MAHEAHVLVETTDVAGDTDFFVGLGFRVDRVMPADDPATVDLSLPGGAGAGPTMAIRLQRSDVDRPLQLALPGERTDGGSSPGGSTVVAAPEPGMIVPTNEPRLVLTRAGGEDARWVTGRAGMRYRDLLPGRWGGRFIASHIHIPDGGPVPDYVHFHRVRFQMIVVKAGWVEVVYQDQGPSFVMHAGDVVLQPPTIRHRVLASSPDLEVVEVGCPAEHETVADHTLDLPNANEPGRRYGGQGFARFTFPAATVEPWRVGGLVAHDTGIGSATDGLVGARIVTADPAAGVDPGSTAEVALDSEFAVHVVLDGTIWIDHPDLGPVELAPGDSLAVPGGEHVRIGPATADLRLLDITAPATPPPIS